MAPQGELTNGLYIFPIGRLYIFPCCIFFHPHVVYFARFRGKKEGPRRPGSTLSAGHHRPSDPPRDDNTPPALNKLHRNPAYYSMPPRSTPAGSKTFSPPRNEPNSGAAQLKCTVLHDPQRPVIPFLRRGPGYGVVCRRKYDDAGSNERHGLDDYYPARCSSRKFIIDSQENVEQEPRGRMLLPFLGRMRVTLRRI